MTHAKDTTFPSPRPSVLPRWALTLSFAAAALVAAPSVSAADRELAGIKVAQSHNLSGRALQLNGAGIRHRGPFKVYTAALYTNSPVGSPAEFHVNNGNKRLILTMLREVNSSQMGGLFIKGVQKNLSAGDLGNVIAELPRMGEIFSANKRLLPGEQLVIDWEPGRGTQIMVRGQPQGAPFESRAFFEALMNIWLGPSPADWQLKDALLGISGNDGTNTL